MTNSSHANNAYFALVSGKKPLLVVAILSYPKRVYESKEENASYTFLIQKTS